ncbi:MAG: hypothetical protein K2G90_01765, partial [Muribaculaceae bacterium]|nr:hypothetical protein [Muribaculaceae bacterium]
LESELPDDATLKSVEKSENDLSKMKEEAEKENSEIERAVENEEESQEENPEKEKTVTNTVKENEE